MSRRGAAGVIIGNEVLSAKVVDQNGTLLCRRLRERGIELRSLTVIPDEVDAIVDAVSRALRQAQYVLTSGGIGPTHDDVTIRAVALALGRPVVRLARMVEWVERYAGPNPSAQALRLAEAPEGSELLTHEGMGFPVLCCAGVYMLPGVPQLFGVQLEAVLGTLPESRFHLRCVYLTAGESEVARILDEVALAFPQVSIGSYPTFDRASDFRVKITVEHREESWVEQALQRLLAGLPPEVVLRVE